MTRQAYSYTVLRYIHDAQTGEYVNIGVVLFAPERGTLLWNMRHTIGRVKDMFPDLDRKAFKSTINDVERAIGQYKSRLSSSDLLARQVDARELARVVVPLDDSSLQWSPLGMGLTDSPESALSRLFSRMVSKHDHHQRRRRTDDEVWKPVQDKLSQRSIDIPLEEKTIQGQADTIHFKRAWKNGVWHCYEPLSMDLADSDNIRDKARRWLGNLTAARSSTERFQAHFIVGKPRNTSLISAYDDAIEILRTTESGARVYPEENIDDLIDRIQEEVMEHRPDNRSRSS